MTATSTDMRALERYAGQTVVVKFGGNAMVDPELEQAFADDIVALHAAGVKPIVVHGGGPQINAHLQRLAVPSTFAGGFRVTTPEIMDVVRMVLVGQVQSNIVTNINRHGPLAVGISGEDAQLLVAERRSAIVDGHVVDIGLVGNVVDINVRPLQVLLDQGYVPVVTGIGVGVDGQAYNVNADTAAGAVAAAMHAAKLVVLTDVPGLYADWPNTDSLITHVDSNELQRMLPSLASGMIPKMEACLDAVQSGVGEAHLVDGREHHVVLQALADASIGTVVTAA